MSHRQTRRKFLGEASCASIGSISVLSNLMNLKLANQAAAAGLTPGSDCKTLVCVLLAGGCDTYNLLVRRDNAGYTEYSDSRSNLALPQSGAGGLLPLNYVPTDPDQSAHRYGLHPMCQGLVDMFEGTGAFAAHGKRLSFISNVGTLIEPTTLASIQAGTAKLPKALFSHSDQVTHWQTSVPQGLGELTGWGGRMADVMHSTMNTQATAMSISLDGNNVFQIGNETTQLAITGDGALRMSGSNPGLGSQTARKNYAVEGLLAENYRNLMQDAFAKHGKESIDAQIAFAAEYDQVSVPSSISNLFPNARIGRELLAAAKTISVRNKLGLRRSTIFVNRGNWDHHGELLNAHSLMLDELSQAISAYQLALEHFGVAEEVISYTASDFGRTLRSNGRGTDHGWGGNQMVFGGPIDGGKVFGKFPSLEIGGSDDVGNGGRMIPTTSVDKYYAELVDWFGVQPQDLDYVLPNFGNFSDTPDIGFLS